MTLFECLGTEDPEHLFIAAHHRALAGNPVDCRLAFDGRSYEGRVVPRRGGGGQIVGCTGSAVSISSSPLAERV
jgi:hypothetical protein